VSDDPIRAFLADSLELWRVAGEVEGGETPVVAVIRVAGTIVWIERVGPKEHVARKEHSVFREAEDEPSPPLPFRWAVRWRAAGDPPGGPRELRPRMCGSLNGLLNALRNALGVDRGSALRIAPAPVDPLHLP
jgi:hypothetical protein